MTVNSTAWVFREYALFVSGRLFRNRFVFGPGALMFGPRHVMFGATGHMFGASVARDCVIVDPRRGDHFPSKSSPPGRLPS